MGGVAGFRPEILEVGSDCGVLLNELEHCCAPKEKNGGARRQLYSQGHA
jgi:hypothetical protein